MTKEIQYKYKVSTKNDYNKPHFSVMLSKEELNKLKNSYPGKRTELFDLLEEKFPELNRNEISHALSHSRQLERVVDATIEIVRLAKEKLKQRQEAVNSI